MLEAKVKREEIDDGESTEKLSHFEHQLLHPQDEKWYLHPPREIAQNVATQPLINEPLDCPKNDNHPFFLTPPPSPLVYPMNSENNTRIRQPYFYNPYVFGPNMHRDYFGPPNFNWFSRNSCPTFLPRLHNRMRYHPYQ